MIELSNFSIQHLVAQFSPIAPLIADTAVTDIMIVTRAADPPVRIFYERRGRLEEHVAAGIPLRLVQSLCYAIARPRGDDPDDKPLLDARLADGSRVAICMPPASPTPSITIRRFSTDLLTAGWLVSAGSLPTQVLSVLSDALACEHNVLVSGGTSSGKTTLLNALIQLFPESARFIVIEDTIELRVEHPNSLRLEARDLARTKITHRDLVKHALRHRPDHIVVGEIRGSEAADVLQALNTGHGGSLSTIHANSASEALFRVASYAMQAMGALPWSIVCRQVATAFNYVVHQQRRPDRTRGVTELIRVCGYNVQTEAFETEEVWPAGAAVATGLPASAVVQPGTPAEFGRLARLLSSRRTMVVVVPRPRGFVHRRWTFRQRISTSRTCLIPMSQRPPFRLTVYPCHLVPAVYLLAPHCLWRRSRMMAESERTPSGVTKMKPETEPGLATDDVAGRDVHTRTARINSDKSMSDSPDPGLDDLEPDSTMQGFAGMSSGKPASDPATGDQGAPKLDPKTLDTKELEGHPIDDDEAPPDPQLVPGSADVDTDTREIDIEQFRDDMTHGDTIVHPKLAGGAAGTSSDPVQPRPPQESGGPSSPESAERAAAARTSVTDDAGRRGDESGSSAGGGPAKPKVDLVDPADVNAVLDGTDRDPEPRPKPSDSAAGDATASADVPAGATAGGGTAATDVGDKKPVVSPKPVTRSTDSPSSGQSPAPPPAERGSGSPQPSDSSTPGAPRQEPPVAPKAAPAGAPRRRLFTDQPPPRIGRSIPRMARSTLAQVAGMPLDFTLDTDEQDEPFLPTELSSLSLQHVLGLARGDEPVDADLEADLKAELGVHGINIDEFQERLNAMLSSRHREHVMYEVQSSFRSVLESVEQLSRLSTGQVRYRNERLSADAQQVVRVLLAVRVAAERVDEAVRLSEQGIRQTHDYAVSLSRLIRDSEVRVKMIHTTAANIESIWHQLRAQQVTAAPERSVVLWCGASAAVGAGVVVALLSLLGY